MATNIASKVDVELTKQELQKSKELGKWIKPNNPNQRGWFGLNPRTERRDGMIIQYDIPISLRDGVKVYGNIYRLQSLEFERLPVLFNYSVYGKDGAIETCVFPPSSGLDKSRITGDYQFEACDAPWWCKRGYAVAFVDARGSFSSEGDKSFFSRDVGLDGYDIVEFLAAQSWANGKVGMYGASAFAMVQWLVAAERPPSLAAILPFDGMTDLYREMSRKGGIPETQFSKLYPLFFSWGNGLLDDPDSPVYDHPYFDEYWQSKIPRLDNIICPAYVVCGWGDHCIHTRGTLNGWEKINSESKYLEIHQYQKWEWALTEESLNRQNAFFAKYLCGKATESDYWPKVRYCMRESFYVGEWRYVDNYPFPNTDYTKFFLTASGGLSRATNPVPQKLAYDAKLGELSFDLPLLQSFEFAGQAKLRLWVEAEGNDNLDLFITLRKTTSDGKEVFFPWQTVMVDGPIGFGFLRTSRRELDEAQSTPFKPFHKHDRDLPPLKENEVVPVDIEILPTSCRFREGDRLRLVISGHDYHQYPPFIPVSRHADTVNKGNHVIHFGGSYDSFLQLPVIPPVPLSAITTKRTVKWSIAAKRVQGWSDEKFISKYTGVHAKMSAMLGARVPSMRSYTQVIAVPKSEIASKTSLGTGASDWDCNTILGWSSLSAIASSFHTSEYIASAGKHIFTDPLVMGSLSETYQDMVFDPITYEGRKEGTQVFVYLPKSASFSAEKLKGDLDTRFDSITRCGSGTGLLRYVLNRDITPDHPEVFFKNTPFADGQWGQIAATEQYWFSDLAAVTAFFSNSSIATEFRKLPASFDDKSVTLVVGKENIVFGKDRDF